MDYNLIKIYTSGFKVRESCFAKYNFGRKSRITEKNVWFKDAYSKNGCL